MAADDLAAFGTFPFLRFAIKKLFDTMFLDVFEVFNHAHSVKSPVTLIDAAKVATREIRTLIAELYLTIQD